MKKKLIAFLFLFLFVAFAVAESSHGEDGVGAPLAALVRQQRMPQRPQSVRQADKKVRSRDWARRLAREFIACRAYTHPSDGDVAGAAGGRCCGSW